MAKIQKFGGFRFIQGHNPTGSTYAVSDVINYITGNTELQNAICFVSTGADTKRPNYIVFNGKAFGDAEALNQYLNELQVSAIADSAENDAKIPQVIAVKNYVATKIGEVNTAISNLNKTVTASTNNLEIQIVQENGLLKTITLKEKALDGDIATASGDTLNKLVNAGQVKGYVDPQIETLKGRIDGLGTAAHSNVLTGSTISGTSEYLTTEGQVKTYVDGEITNAINGLDSTATATTAHLNVQIVQTDGELTSVTVEEKNFGDAANRDALSTDATISGNAGEDKLVSAKQVVGYVNTTIDGLDSTGTGTSKKSGIKVDVVQTDGKITGVAVEDTLGTAAKSDKLVGDITGKTTSDDLVSAKQVNDLVATLDADITSEETTNGGIKVQVVETDGKIANVVVTDKLGTVAKRDVLTADIASLPADTTSGTTIPTVEQVKAYVTSSVASLNGAMHFIGAVDKLPENNSGYTAGDVILVGNKEYVFTKTNQWVELGDESIYVAKATEIAGIQIQSGITKDALMDALGLDKTGLNADVTSTGNTKIAVQVVETKGKITAVNVTDNLGTAASANVLTGTIAGATEEDATATTYVGNLVTAGQVKALIKDDLDKKFIKSVNGQTPTSGSVTIDGNIIQIHPVDANYNPTPDVSIVNYQGNVENAIIGLENAIAKTSRLSSIGGSITVNATDYSGAKVNDIAVNIKTTFNETDVKAGNAVELKQQDGNGPLYGVMYYIADEITNIEIPTVQGGGGLV